MLPGLATAEDLIGRAEEVDLLTRLATVDLSPFRFQQWTGKRLTRSFGWTYDFENGRFGPTDPMPDWLLPLRERAARFAKLAPERLVQALLIRYDPGAGIGWHRDRPVFDHVVGVSLGSAATLRFRRRREQGFDRRSLPLAPRSVYHLAGEARQDWEHGMAPVVQTRWSVTFRSLREAPPLDASARGPR
ncbi:alpha-ketoglutarate-dependent dioxygenase AlkB [Novosphingobium soli]